MWVGKNVVGVLMVIDSLQTFSLAGTAVLYIYIYIYIKEKCSHLFRSLCIYKHQSIQSI